MAEVRGDGDRDESDGEIVGEAQYAPLPNGAGELGLAVDRPWRDRVATLLLDALVDRAAGDGVANLEADVAHHDVTLRALLDARGAATVRGDGWRVTRLRVGTTGPTPTWSPGDRPRLLVEGPGGRWPFVEELRGGGFDVIVCPGPRAHSCPVLRGLPCALAADAVVVVTGSPGAWPALFAAHDTLHPGVPVAVEPQPRPPAPTLDDTIPTSRPRRGNAAWARRDSNPGPPPCHGGALTN